ncbi:hypothetical protein F4806DRAFT_496112 [Annulohypoxylon nitens]|nr:hypothetical protein F4806DRAFT_496112 [Annulohypoxylon nitens]
MNTTLHYRLDLMEIRPIEGKGVGVFARRDIPQNTLLSLEYPAFVFARNNRNPQTELQEFCEAFYNSTAEQQTALRTLHADWRHMVFSALLLPKFREWHEKNYDMTGSKLDLDLVAGFVMDAHAKWHTNNGLVTDDPVTEANTGAAWLNFSRFNHSCDPNTTWVCEPDADSVLSVVTERDIPAGEEICLSYIAMGKILQERRNKLMFWGFKCICSKCVQEESLLKPGEMVGAEDLNKDIPRWPGDDKAKQGFEEIGKEIAVPDLKLFLPRPNYGNDGNGGSGGSGGGSPASDATIMTQLEMNYEIELEIIAIERTKARCEGEKEARRQLVSQAGSQSGSQSGSQHGSQHSSPGASKSGSQ